jgi:TetR/AcrR family transcriptional repressor of nem operon
MSATLDIVVPARADHALTGATAGARKRLVHAAASLVHAESYHSVGVKAICEKAGVQRGSFYHFFPSKTALVLEALDLTWEKFDREGLAASRDINLTARCRIEGVIDYVYDSQRRFYATGGHVLGCIFGNLAAEANTLDEKIRQRLVVVFDDWAAAFEAPIVAAQGCGEISDRVLPSEAATELVADLQGAVTLAKVHNDPEIIAAGGQAILERFWHCSQGDCA